MVATLTEPYMSRPSAMLATPPLQTLSIQRLVEPTCNAGGGG